MRFGISKNSVENLSALVHLSESLFSNANRVRGEALSMFNQVLLDLFDDFIGATANLSNAAEEPGSVLEGQIQLQVLINEFVFNNLPKLVVLQLHQCCCLNCLVQRGACMLVEATQLLLDKRNKEVPEILCLFKLVLSDKMESMHNQLVSQDELVLLADEDNVASVLGSHKSHGGLVEVGSGEILRIRVATRVDKPLSRSNKTGGALG